MELPANFETPPGEELHRAFRNTCIEFKKLIKSSKDLNELKEQMQKFIEISKQMNWHVKNTGIYHKAEGEKLADKVFAEFKRYMQDLEPYLNKANPADLLKALDGMERYINDFQVT
jgi:hypothetical protein